MEKSLKEWYERIIIKRPELGGMPICPFAKKGVRENKVLCYPLKDDILKFVIGTIECVKGFELIIFYDENKQLTNDELVCIIEDLQKIKSEFIFLKDHPDFPGNINGVNTGNGVYPCILVQPRDSLEKAREELKKTKYYDYWSEEYKKEIWGYGSESKSD